MVRDVLRYPHPGLKQVCAPVAPDRAEAVVQDLVDTMNAHAGCVGLAAPQIGEPVRVAVVNVAGHRLTTSSSGLVVLVNPSLHEGVSVKVAREGCLSLPDITADVARHERILVTPRPGDPRLWADGFEARAIQHEMDHLDGILILDRVASVRAIFPRRRPAGS